MVKNKQTVFSGFSYHDAFCFFFTAVKHSLSTSAFELISPVHHYKLAADLSHMYVYMPDFTTQQYASTYVFTIMSGAIKWNSQNICWDSTTSYSMRTVQVRKTNTLDELSENIIASTVLYYHVSANQNVTVPYASGEPICNWDNGVVSINLLYMNYLPSFITNTVICHEIGHVMGLADVNDTTSIMHQNNGGSATYPSADDRAGILALYGVS